MEQTLDRLYANYPREFADIGCSVLRVPLSDLYNRAEQYQRWKSQLHRLLTNPGIAQRTDEWYKARENLITASDIAQALGKGKFGTVKQFYQKKCGRADEQAPFDYTIPPLKWGTIYETIAQGIYARMNNVKIHEFGLLIHGDVPFIGASPDGISDLGIMLEIKCPWRRKIEQGNVPLQYFHQIQAQLAVCDLDECDYFECAISECLFGPSDDAWSATSPMMRGVFVEVSCPHESVPYKCIYPPEHIIGQGRDRTQDLIDWSNTFENAVFHWWYLTDFNCVRVKRDHDFIERMFSELAVVWTNVLDYRKDRSKYLDEVGVPSVKSKSTAKTTIPADELETINMFANKYMFV